ncbi:uncharacterized protein LOC113238216 [Hyposmocoma kahamanoa]|uniref:uncharacterized protein LOC113238216 n=1 Tax=Hyposmocoma kahamanoa TaxID=1477025 RepID=UPI000E6D6511|nr:uncharacterized protein LOC113238216 [Hyposmocoma kahamanoa]
MIMKYVLCLAVLVVSLRNVKARLSAESETALTEYGQGYLSECAKELNLDLEHLKPSDIQDKDKCLFTCTAKKMGVINGEGKFDLDKVLEILVGLVKNLEDYKTLETIAKSCISVNDEKVSDGVKGCERTFLAVSCVTKQKELLE